MKIRIDKKSYYKTQKIETKLDKEFLYLILHFLERFPKVENDFIQLSSMFLKNIKWDYEKYLKLLKTNNVIVCNEKFIPGLFAKGYKLFSNIYNYTENPELIEITISDSYKNDISDIEKRVIDTYNHITVDPDVWNILNSKKLEQTMGTTYVNQISTHLKTIDQKLPINTSLSKTGRIFHPFSEMASELRYYCLLDGNRLFELDCANSQPFFLSILMFQKNKNIYQNVDAELYRQLVVSGGLYGFFLGKYKEIFPKVKVDIIDMKMYLLQTFFSDEEGSKGLPTQFRKKTRDVFEKCFPTVFEFIKDYKKYNNLSEDKYAFLAHQLQGLESNVFLNIFSEMFEEHNLPCHDAIYVCEKDVDVVKSTLTEIFHSRYGIVPTIKIKELKPIASVRKFIEQRQEKMLRKEMCNKMWKN